MRHRNCRHWVRRVGALWLFLLLFLPIWQSVHAHHDAGRPVCDSTASHWHSVEWQGTGGEPCVLTQVGRFSMEAGCLHFNVSLPVRGTALLQPTRLDHPLLAVFQILPRAPPRSTIFSS